MAIFSYFEPGLSPCPLPFDVADRVLFSKVEVEPVCFSKDIEFELDFFIEEVELAFVNVALDLGIDFTALSCFIVSGSIRRCHLFFSGNCTPLGLSQEATARAFPEVSGSDVTMSSRLLVDVAEIGSVGTPASGVGEDSG